MPDKDKSKQKFIKKMTVKSVRNLSSEEYEREEKDKENQQRKAHAKAMNNGGTKHGGISTGETLFSGDYKDARCLFLRGISMIYFIAFMSIYLQIEGLYGSNGVTPVKAELKLATRTAQECLQDKRSLLCYMAPELGLNPHYAMELLALFGVVLSGLGSLCIHCCVAPVMFMLWLAYFSIYQVGGVFLSFQWDILLLEAGVLAIIAAPWFPTKNAQAAKPRDLVSMWMVQWLLFRLMFSSGVVKLQSGCPTWWGLDALQYHFQSQCIPTPLAFYFHHLPAWVLRLMVVGTYFIEIGAPVLFFSPFTFLKRIGFWLQVLLQFSIIATGNYTYFNFLTIVLCFSLLDSGFFKSERSTNTGGFPVGRLFSLTLQFTALGMMLLYTVRYFNLTPAKDFSSVGSKITFSRVEFDAFMSHAVPYSLALGFVSLASKISQSLVISMFDMPGAWKKMTSILSTVFYGLICFTLFAVTCVPFSSLHPETNKALWPAVRELHGNLSRYHVTSGYGLFRRMTGTDNGRPEVILEYADDIQGPWKEYSFMYKPGDVSMPPAIVAPHQPRLDWQMWFAALGTYHENPWLVSLSYRLLQGGSGVQKLLNTELNPKVVPKFVRASSYQYVFTKPTEPKDWWSRKRTTEYMPIFSSTHPPLVDFIKKMGYLDSAELPKNTVMNPRLIQTLDTIRNFTQSYRPEYIIWGSLMSILLLILTSKLFK